MTGIYLIINNTNQKCYVGQSVAIEERMKAHRWHGSPSSLVDMAIKNEGWENFTWTVLEECSSTQLDEREKYWIQHYKSFECGYNSTQGGAGTRGFKWKTTSQEIQEIQNLLISSDLSQLEIAERYHLSKDYITDINLGRAHVKDELVYPLRNNKTRHNSTSRKCIDCGCLVAKGSQRCAACERKRRRQEALQKKPPQDELVKDIALHGFEATGRKHQVSGNAIRKWCRKMGLPTTISEIKRLYHSGHSN